MPRSHYKIACSMLFGSVVAMTGCAGIPEDRGLSDIQSLVEQIDVPGYVAPRIEPDSEPQTAEVDHLLARPLQLGEAENLGLRLNPAVRVHLAEVGLAHADLAQVGRISNPTLSFERFAADDYGVSLLFHIGDLLLLPLNRQIERDRLEAAQISAAAAILEQVAETRRAWFDAVAERQQFQRVERMLESARAEHNLSRQMSALGHTGALQAAQAEILLGELESMRVRQFLVTNDARERLIRVLGLWGEQARRLEVPARLPELPAMPQEIEAVERLAITNRLDVRLSRAVLRQVTTRLKVPRLETLMASLEAGPVREISDGEREAGWELEFEIPLFDTGAVRSERARLVVEQARANAESVAIAAASQARSAYLAHRSTWEMARHFEDQLLPLRNRVSRERLLRYNGMLISVFDLLADLRDAAALEARYVDSVRDFWLADTGLQQALAGGGGGGLNLSTGPGQMSPSAGDGDLH